jgi:ankyrin repeat protein
MSALRPLGHLILLVAIALAACLSLSGEEAATDVEGANLVVMINGQTGGTPTFGSGIIFAREKDRVYLVTANHVVRSGGVEANDLQIRFKPWPDKTLKAKLLPQSDRDLDLAVLAVEDPAGQGVGVCKWSLDRLADPARVKRGDDVFPLGNPNGIAWGMPVKPDAISDVTGDSIVFQSAFVARGHSGGGLFDAGGLLVGMIQADEPPFGRALGMRKILEVLRALNLPVQLRVPLPDNATPLLGAAWNGNLSEVKLLLREPCTDVNAGGGHNPAPLNAALRRGKFDVAKLLVEAGAKVNSRNYGGTPLDEAARSGSAEMVEFLISHGAQANTCCALATASASGALDAVKVLLAHGADPNRVVNSGNQTPLFSVVNAREGRKNQGIREEVLWALIKAGANVNWVDKDGDTPLTLAVENANLGAVKILLEAGANVDVKNRNKYSPIRLVTQTGQGPAMREIAALLVQSSTKIDPEDGERLLSQSAREGWSEVVDLLAQRGVNVKGESGNEALEEAVTKGNVEVVRMLLQAGANPNGSGSPTPLVRVLGGIDGKGLEDPAKRLEMVKLLVSKGARVNVYATEPFLFHMEPLYLALIKLTPPDLKVAEFLIMHGANVNEADHERQTLLDLATDLHRPEAAKLLLQAGARKGLWAK